MAGFSFLSRFAFICNIFFVGAAIVNLFVLYDQAEKLGFFADTAIVMGMILAPILNMGVNIWYILLRVARKPVRVASWLIVTNLIVLIAQIFYYLILPA